MVEKRNVVTGATGLLGSHLAEQLLAAGEAVRALVRPASDAALLHQLGAEVVATDLLDLAAVRQAVGGADVVYHCAARVGDWGAWPLFHAEVVEPARVVAEACRLERVGRLLHVSSVGVYGRPAHARLMDEDEPLGQNPAAWDRYCRAKIEAEAVVRQRVPDATVVRPSWIYGPRDRHSLPRLVEGLRGRRLLVVGSGANQLSLIFAGDVAEGAILAANEPRARGEAYNLSTPGEVTQQEFLDLLTESLGLPPVRLRVPYGVAFAAGWASEVVGRMIGLGRAPHVTRYGVALMCRPPRYRIEKAHRHFGWQPRTDVREGLRRTLEWFHNQEAQSRPLPSHCRRSA